MTRFLQRSVLALAAWGLLATVSPSFARAQTYDCPTVLVSYPPQVTTTYSPPPVVTYSAPAPTVTYSAPAPVVTYAAPVVTYPAPVVTYSTPVVTYAPPVVTYSAPVVAYSVPTRVVPVRYSFYSPPVVAYSAPVYAGTYAPYASTTHSRGLFGRRVYNTTYYGPFAYPAAYGSAYYTPGYFRY
jgi:hypothetical protein